VPAAVQIPALQPVNQKLCFVNVSPQRSRFAPDGRCSAIRAGDILTFKPRQLAGHFVQLIAQRADQLHGLGGIASIHGGSVARLALSQTRNGPGRSQSTQRNENTVTVPEESRRTPDQVDAD
jgi:hypothetical protein